MSAPIEQATEDDLSARYGLTDSGWTALAVDDAIQAALDREALDAIAALVRSTPRADPGLLDLVAEQVAATRRHIRTGQIE